MTTHRPWSQAEDTVKDRVPVREQEKEWAEAKAEVREEAEEDRADGETPYQPLYITLREYFCPECEGSPEP